MKLQVISRKIHEIRGQKVMLDYDLATLYEVETKRLKEAVKRNRDRFPGDFMFELTRDEYNALRSQIATLEGSRKGRHSKYNPYAFTEHGIAMLSSVLGSKKAIQVNIAVIRAFIVLRQFALSYKEVADKIAEMEKKYDKRFADIYEALNLLLKEKEKAGDWENRRLIGYKN